jgi:hypothetical protein
MKQIELPSKKLSRKLKMIKLKQTTKRRKPMKKESKKKFSSSKKQMLPQQLQLRKRPRPLLLIRSLMMNI